MSLLKTFDNIEAEILERCDLVSTQLPSGALDRLTNDSLRSLYRILVAANRDLYLKESSAITITAGTSAYSLATPAADFWRGVGVEVLEGGRRYPLKRFLWANRNRFQGSNMTARRTGYRLMALYLRLFPTPTWSGTVYVWYIPAPPTLTTGGSWEGFAGFERWAVFDACAQLRTMFEEDASGFIADRNRIEQEIRDSASEVDDAEPDCIRDVEGDSDDDAEFSSWA